MNLWAQFRALLPADPLVVVEIIAHNLDGTSTVTTPEGGVMRVLGQGVAVGLRAFVRSGAVEGEAPTLPVYTAEV